MSDNLKTQSGRPEPLKTDPPEPKRVRDTDHEIQAMRRIDAALSGLPWDVAGRVLDWATARHEGRNPNRVPLAGPVTGDVEE